MVPDLQEINLLKSDLDTKGKFKVEDIGNVNEYLGVKTTHLAEGRIKLEQPDLMAQLLQDLYFQEDTKSTSTPANSSTILGGVTWVNTF
jgi:hypothetical protein